MRPPLIGHTGEVLSLMAGRIGGQNVIVSGSSDHTVRIWDAATGLPFRAPLTGHVGNVTSVVIGRIGGQDVIVSGSSDHTVRIWDAATGKIMAIVDTVAPVEAVMLSGVNTLYIAAGQAICAFATSR